MNDVILTKVVHSIRGCRRRSWEGRSRVQFVWRRRLSCVPPGRRVEMSDCVPPSWHRTYIYSEVHSSWVSDKTKRHAFYSRLNLVRCHPILPIRGRNIPQRIWNKRIYTVSQKTVQNCSCHNFVKFPPTLIW